MEILNKTSIFRIDLEKVLIRKSVKKHLELKLDASVHVNIEGWMLNINNSLKE